MTRRGRRSIHAQQRRYVNRLVSINAHRDRQRAESVNQLTPRQILHAVAERFGFADLNLTHLFTRGEVLSDDRGRGSLQQVRM